MPIRAFASSQTLDFLIVAKRLEKTWSTPTLCVRILLRDGSELEVQASDEASEQWNTLPKQIAFTMTVTRACVKPNKATNVTGIVSTHLLRFKYAITSLKRANDGFDTSVKSDRNFVQPDQLEQLESGKIVNLAGVVHAAGKPPDANDKDVLQRRVVSIQHGDWHTPLTLVGELSTKHLEVGQSIFVASVRKNAYKGLLELETSRLSFILTNPSWLRIPDRANDTPSKKALRNETLDPVPISVVKNATQPEPKCVDAQMQELTTTVFEQSIWCGERGDRMRLLITLRDDSAMLPVIVWSTEFPNIISQNCDELAVLYAACENGENEKKEFLEALNENANETRRWVLRPREWSRSDGSKVIQWTVAGVNTPP